MLITFEHHRVLPDTACHGNGASGEMLRVAADKTDELMSLHGPGEMNSTSSGEPVVSATARDSARIVLHYERLMEKHRGQGFQLSASSD